MTNAVVLLLRRNNNKTPTIKTIIITYLAQLSDLCFTCGIILPCMLLTLPPSANLLILVGLTGLTNQKQLRTLSQGSLTNGERHSARFAVHPTTTNNNNVQRPSSHQLSDDFFDISCCQSLLILPLPLESSGLSITRLQQRQVCRTLRPLEIAPATSMPTKTDKIGDGFLHPSIPPITGKPNCASVTKLRSSI
jgi:hypothetical protein